MRINSLTALGGTLLPSSKKSHSCDTVLLNKCPMVDFCCHVEKLGLVLGVYVWPRKNFRHLCYLCYLFHLSRETMCAWVEGMET